MSENAQKLRLQFPVFVEKKKVICRETSDSFFSISVFLENSYEQLSWLGSINIMGAIFASFTFGFIISFLGCKRAINLLFLPPTVFYLLIYFGDTYSAILFARFMMGVSGGGMQTTLIIYITDISSNLLVDY